MAVEKEWELLGIILERMTEVYGKFADVLRRQRRAVIENRVQDLLQLHTEMESLNESIARLDQRRVGHMTNISLFAGKEMVNLQDLVNHFPHIDGAPLLAKSAALKAVVAEIQRITKSNVELIDISRKVVQETMQTILNQNIDPRDKAWRTYGASGGYSRTVRREPVHLVNRRG